MLSVLLVTLVLGFFLLVILLVGFGLFHLSCRNQDVQMIHDFRHILELEKYGPLPPETPPSETVDDGIDF